jgi:transposase
LQDGDVNYTDVKPQQWHVLEKILPANPGRGRPFKDHKPIINGILWRIKGGAPWRLIPSEYGPWQTCYDRFRTWERDGTWENILQTLQTLQAETIDWDECGLDSTTTKVHRSARGARHEPAQADAHKRVIKGEWIGHSRGGPGTKIHFVADQVARPLTVYLTPGQASDGANMMPTLNRLNINSPGKGRPRKRPISLRVDRAYGARTYRKALRKVGIRCICPERKDTREARLRRGSRGGRPTAFDAEAYKGRNVVERCANRLKDFRAVATRYEKRARSYRAIILVAMIMIWLP